MHVVLAVHSPRDISIFLAGGGRFVVLNTDVYMMRYVAILGSATVCELPGGAVAGAFAVGDWRLTGASLGGMPRAHSP